MQLIKENEVQLDSDLDIIAQVRLGNRNAFSSLVDRYQTRVRGFCFHMLSDTATAEEAAQDVFLKAFNSLDRFRADAAFSTWLYRIAKNHCLDIIRSRSRMPQDSWDQIIEERGEPGGSSVSPLPRPEQDAEYRDLVSKALALLSEDYRNVIVLREIQGLSYTEIAQVLDCSLDSVKAKLRRARKEFQNVVRHFSESNHVETTRGSL